MVLWLDIGTNSVVTHKTKEYFIIPNGFFLYLFRKHLFLVRHV